MIPFTPHYNCSPQLLLITCSKVGVNKISSGKFPLRCGYIAALNDYIKQSIRRYEIGETLASDVGALALYNIILIQPGTNHYGIEANDWARFEAFVKGDATPPGPLNVVEKDVLLTSAGKKLSFIQLGQIQQILEVNGSRISEQIVQLLQNLQRIGTSINIEEEDVLITEFVEPLLMEPFLRSIANTAIHGNGHPLRESHFRKTTTAERSGLPSKLFKDIRGRAPDRTIEYQMSEEKKFSVLVAEIKTKNSARRHPDFVKLATLMKDTLDFTIVKGHRDCFVTGLLVAGSSCKVLKLHMPIERLYALTEVASFSLPDGTNDIILHDKVMDLIVAMSECQKMVKKSIIHLSSQTSNINDPCEHGIVSSYPSPAHHYSYHK